MTENLPSVMMRGTDHWLRAAHENTALDTAGGIVSLAWDIETPVKGEADPLEPAGLAFDPWCRLYCSRPETGQIDRLLWTDRRNAAAARPMFAPAASGNSDPGAFQTTDSAQNQVTNPRGLAVDAHGRLFVAETDRITVVDLADNRVLVLHRPGFIPVHLATDGRIVVASGAASDGTPRLASMTAARDPIAYEIQTQLATPGPLAFDKNGRLFVLDAPGTDAARLVPLDEPDAAVAVPHAASLAFDGDGAAVLARGPGTDFERLRFEPGGWSNLPQLKAAHYDGRGITRDPTGRIAFWTANGMGNATHARLVHTTKGRVIGFQLDAGRFGTRWGKVLVEACIPSGTDITLQCIATDTPPTDSSIPSALPVNIGTATIHRPDLTPPLPAASLIEAAAPPQSLHRRATPAVPWRCAAADGEFSTFEAPVISPPGRYLWIVAHLSGKVRATPRLRAIRAEHPAPDLLRRLPKIFSAEPEVADFLHRYLSMTGDQLNELDTLAHLRHRLLRPESAPAGMLSWLAGLLGLTIDARWPEAATRAIVADAIWLFRNRGTVAGLKRFVELFLGRDVVLVEHFKTRGLGGGFAGAEGAEANAPSDAAVVGAFRVGGSLSEEGDAPTTPDAAADAITAHAHKFTLLVPVMLDQDQRDVITHILNTHRPAHTIFDLCSVDSGMRTGIGLHLGLSSIVGATSGFGELQVGGSALGMVDIIGRPGMAGTWGRSHLGIEARTG